MEPSRDSVHCPGAITGIWQVKLPGTFSPAVLVTQQIAIPTTYHLIMSAAMAFWKLTESANWQETKYSQVLCPRYDHTVVSVYLFFQFVLSENIRIQNHMWQVTHFCLKNKKSRRTEETQQNTMKHRKHASPGMRLATFISLALCSSVFSRFSMLFKTPHLLLQSEKDMFVQERNTAERQLTVGTHLQYI